MNVIAILLLIPMVLIKIAGVLLGLIMVPIALATQHMTVVPGDHSKHWPDFLWVWGNDEEGCPEWWLKREHPWFIRYWPRFWWFAVRNPFNNFRFVFTDVNTWRDLDRLETNWSIDVPMEAGNILALTGQDSAYRYVRKDWKCGYRRVWLNGDGKYSEFWIGWKLGSPVPGLGFAMQLRLKRKIGT